MPVVKFQMWSLLHILFILSPFLLTVIIYFLTRNKNDKQKNTVGIILSIVAILLLVLRNVEIFVNGGYKIQPEIIPFQICHFANFILLAAFLTKRKTLFTIAFCFNLPAALMSIVFADSLVNYATIMNFRGMAYIWGHMLIVAITLWAYFTHQINITRKSFIYSIITVFSLFVLSVPVNNLFNWLMPTYEANYFYTFKPESGTPLQLMFDLGKTTSFLSMKVNFIYVLTMGLVGVVVLHIFLGLYHLDRVKAFLKRCLSKLPCRKKA